MRKKKEVRRLKKKKLKAKVNLISFTKPVEMEVDGFFKEEDLTDLTPEQRRELLGKPYVICPKCKEKELAETYYDIGCPTCEWKELWGKK